MMKLIDLENYLIHTMSQGGTSIETDGIGHYEYWGAKCFDKGTQFLIYDGPRRITIPLNQIEDDALDDIANGDADISYTFNEYEMELTVQVDCTLNRDHLLIKISEID